MVRVTRRSLEFRLVTSFRNPQPKWMGLKAAIGRVLASLVAFLSAPVGATVLTFDDLPDGTVLTTQYQSLGVTAAGATVLDDLYSPWPAHSAPNVVYAPAGLITFTFAPAVTGSLQSVSAYVSGYSAVGLYAYDASGTVLGQTLLPTNGGANVMLAFTSPGNPIASVQIHDGGGTFVVDDLTFTGAPNYTVTALGLGGSGGGVSPHGINGTGQVAGFATTASGASHAFFYPGTAIQDLGTLGGGSSSASAVNGSGRVVGFADTKNKQRHAFSWNSASGMVDLGTLGGTNSSATALNGSGQIVGSAQTRKNLSHAFSWASGLMTDLGTLGGDTSAANDVNAIGQVIGWAQARKGLVHAFLWAAGVISDLGTLGGSTSTANAINDAGQVVGVASTAGGQNHAFSWTSSGGMIDLGTLGGASSTASGVNASGQVVGIADTSAGQSHAFSWKPAGGLVDLGTLGGNAANVGGVNALGKVVGAAQIAGGEWHAFAWTPAGGMVDLNNQIPHAPAGLKLFSALAVSDNGVIVAQSNSGLVLLAPSP